MSRKILLKISGIDFYVVSVLLCNVGAVPARPGALIPMILLHFGTNGDVIDKVSSFHE